MSNRYYLYTIVDETLIELCKSVSCSAQEIIRINTQMYNDNMTVGQAITESQSSGSPLPMGMSVRIPYPITGGKEINYTNYEVTQIKDNVTETTYKVKGAVQESESFRYTLSKPSAYPLLSTVKDSWKNFNCFITVYANRGQVGSPMMLPVYPQEFNDTNEARFNSTSIFGRSVDYQTYTGSGRSVSLTLQMHEELCTDKTYMHRLVKKIESACYPGYSSNQVRVPEISITIGNQFKCRGILTNCSANWKAPIIDGKLVNCDLSIGIRETTGPFSMSNIASMGGYRNG